MEGRAQWFGVAWMDRAWLLGMALERRSCWLGKSMGGRAWRFGLPWRTRHRVGSIYGLHGLVFLHTSEDVASWFGLALGGRVWQFGPPARDKS